MRLEAQYDFVVSEKDQQSYERGVKLAEDFLAKDGDPNADGPDTKDEAFFNGFIDTLTKFRESMKSGKKNRL